MRSSWGSVREVAADTWELRWHDGAKRHSKRVHGTRKDAEHELAKLRLRYEGAAHEDVTVSEYWLGWFSSYLQTLAPGTQRGYKDVYKNHIQPIWGDSPMQQMRVADIQRWLLSLSYGVAPHARTLLSSMFSKAFADGLIDRNPMSARYRMPERSQTAKKTNADIFPLDVAAQVLKLSAGEWWRPLYVLSMFGGCRRGEAVGCRVEDIEICEGAIAYTVRNNIQVVQGELINRPPKTGERTAIVLQPYAQAIIDAIDMRTGGWLVEDVGGRPVNPNALTVAWRRWLSNQPVAGIPWKNLRNSYVSMMLEQGHPIELVSRLCGHSKMIEYQHYDRRNAAALLASLGVVAPLKNPQTPKI